MESSVRSLGQRLQFVSSLGTSCSFMYVVDRRNVNKIRVAGMCVSVWNSYITKK